MLNQSPGEKGQDAIAAVLRYGSTISTVVMAVGLALAFVRGGAKTGPQSLMPGALLMKAVELDPLGVTQLGILLLLLTPVLRVVVAVISFGFEHNSKYVLISSGVLLIILGSIAFALR